MKKIVLNIRLAMVAVLMLLASLAVSAETYTWSKYDLTFEMPKGGLVTYNSATVFELRWQDLTVSIRLFDKSGADDNFLKYNLQKSAAGYNMFDTQLRKSKMKGFKGYNINGTLPDGSRACLTNVVSKKTNLAMVIEINYLRGSEDIVNDILKSFVEGKKQKIKKEKKQKQKIQKKGEKQKPIKPGTTEGSTPPQIYEI